MAEDCKSKQWYSLPAAAAAAEILLKHTAPPFPPPAMDCRDDIANDKPPLGSYITSHCPHLPHHPHLPGRYPPPFRPSSCSCLTAAAMVGWLVGISGLPPRPWVALASPSPSAPAAATPVVSACSRERTSHTVFTCKMACLLPLLPAAELLWHPWHNEPIFITHPQHMVGPSMLLQLNDY
jgi:hypothetical protein